MCKVKLVNIFNIVTLLLSHIIGYITIFFSFDLFL